ncbi:MAG: hypothetical protein JXA96_11480 [Sedimentisphaerales bacterium]|nr:hypothetical protein [Sedimentisphaerales bacterium]
MKTLFERIIQLVVVLFFCVQPLQAQTLPEVAFKSSSSGHYETYSPTVPISVVLSEVSTETVYVAYAVTGGTATNGVDYLLSSGELMFSPGETTKDITIYLVHDLFGEIDETVIISLGNPINATLGYPSTHTYTIANDDWNSFGFLQSGSSGPESESTVSITVGYFRLINIGDVSVNYQVIGGTATGGGVDYILDSGTLEFELGQSMKDIEITIVDDSITEENETIIVKLVDGEPNSIGLMSTFTYTILNDDDDEAPIISEYYPEPNSIQVPRDTYIKLNITDNLSGVDANTVQIYVDGITVYNGSLADSNGVYNSFLGTCRLAGTETDYTFIFLLLDWFDYEQEVDVVVHAKDKYGNTMPKDSFSFHTVMRSFGNNLKVNTGSDSFDQDHPAAVTDLSGNIWIVWDHTKSSSDTDIHIGKLTVGENSFETSTVVCDDAGIQNYPVIAVDSDNNLYVAWQGQSTTGGNWDIYVSKSTDGTTWSTPAVVNFNDSSNNYSQNLPAIAIDHDTTDTIYITCQDNRDGNQDIWFSSSTNGTTWTPKRITTNTKDQTGPVIAINLNHDVYIGWTDARNASTDFYGATSYNSWANQGWVSTSSDQSNVAIATDPITGLLHEFWVDNANGYYDIFYRMQGTSSTGVSVTDEVGVGKNLPAAGVALIDGLAMPFVAWRDWRNVQSNSDTDIYYAEKTLSGFGTNILINDDIGTSSQSNPAVNVGISGSPYIVWADQRNGNKDIYYCGVTSFGDPFSMQYIPYGYSTILKTSEDVEITVSPGAIPTGFSYNDISVSKLLNPPTLPEGGCGVCYDFRPSGLTFNQSVTIVIPHDAEDCPNYNYYQVYWYNTETDTWSKDGISDVEHHILTDSIHTITFRTTHFTSFIVGLGDASSGGGDSGGGSSSGDASSDSGGGGCAMSTSSQSPEEIFGYFLPYVVYVMILLTISWKYKRKRLNNGN